MKRAAGFSVGLAIVALLSSFAIGSEWLHRSLPQLDGRVSLSCLSTEVRIQRDGLGVPTIDAVTRDDLSCALGFLHAQDRFFQMDLMRRRAAGRLAELIGSPAAAADQAIRVHRFAARAEAEIDRLAPGDREALQRYAAGVNAGLHALGAAPPEYALLRVMPEQWTPADSLLAAYAMYALLHEPVGQLEATRSRVREVFPAELADFLDPVGTVWDAPLQGQPLPIATIPAAAVFDLRSLTERPQARALPRNAAVPVAAPMDPARPCRTAAPEAHARPSTPIPGSIARLRNFSELEAIAEPSIPGSNNMAVHGSRTNDGRALLANDMHLPLGLPNTWYRAIGRIEGDLLVAGVTLPGVPVWVAGTNDRIAWGVTNAQGDFADLIDLQLHPDDPQRYRIESGEYVPFETHREEIRIHDASSVWIDIRETIWGPVISQDPQPVALAWIAHQPGAVNLELIRMERLDSVEDALSLAARCRIPPQNLLVADRAGNIGWTLIGPIPNRRGDGRISQRWDNAEHGWDGFVPPERYPRVVNPPSGVLWTANNRVVGGEVLRLLGDGGYDLGARASGLRDAMQRESETTEGMLDEEQLLRTQLSDRAPLIAGWNQRLLAQVAHFDPAPGSAQAIGLSVLRTSWTGHASVDSAAYRIARAFRFFTAERVFEPFDTLLSDEERNVRVFNVTHQWEGPLVAMVEGRPVHLLNPRFDTWDDLLDDAAAEALELVQNADGVDGNHARWGERNRVQVGHPIARAVPQLAPWLNAPEVSLPGDAHLPRVQSPTFGASERLVVAPGALERGIFHMPGGQSGHFLSPFYLAGHQDWVEGNPSPLLPGPTQHLLVLVPSSI